MAGSKNGETMFETMQRLAEKKAEKVARRKEAVENGEVESRFLLVRRTPTGMYVCKWEGGGPLPEVLRTQFTTINRLRQAVISKYGHDDHVKWEEA